MDANVNQVAILLGDKLQSTTPLVQDDRAYIRIPARAALYVHRCSRAWVQIMFRVPSGRWIIQSFVVLYMVFPVFWKLPVKLIMSWIALLLLSLVASMHMWDCLSRLDSISWLFFTWPISLQVSSIRK